MEGMLHQTRTMTEDQLFKDLLGSKDYETEWKDSNLARKTDGKISGPQLKMRKFSSLSKDEQDEEEAKYKRLKESNSFVKGSDINSSYMRKVRDSKVKIDGREITQDALLDRVRKGDYSHMQQLNPVLRNRAATEYMISNPIPQNETPEEFVENFKAAQLRDGKDPVSAMLNPLFRIGISLMMNSKDVLPEVAERYRRIDDLLNKEIMMATLTKRKCMVDDGEEADKNRNVRSQVFIMKTLLTSHLGRLKMKKKNDNPQSRDWPYSMANAFAHCSRVMITLPGTQGQWNENNENNMLNSFYGNAGFVKRSGATHNMVLKRKDGTKAAKEEKSFTPFNQYGMNVAIGGLGNNGIPAGTLQNPTQRAIRNDGSCGHLFMHLEKGDKDKNSGMLIGFESDAYGVMNQTGHVHDLKATGEFASSFGGQRCDEIGDKYGGREADLSEIDLVAYTELMNLLDTSVTSLLESPRADGDNAANQAEQVKLKTIADQLSGNLMDKAHMIDFIKNLYEVQHVGDAEDRARIMYNRLYAHTGRVGND